MKRVRIIAFVSTVVFLVILSLPAPVAAQETFSATLSGYNENPALYSPGSGEFRMTISEDGASFDYELIFDGLPTRAMVGHIHIGKANENGPVVIFLCGGGGRPACESGTLIRGTVTTESVTAGAAAQGFPAGDLDRVIDAIRNGATYANVHTMERPGGEIRGTVFSAK
jgi:hypothetical protein